MEYSRAPFRKWYLSRLSWINTRRCPKQTDRPLVKNLLNISYAPGLAQGIESNQQSSGVCLEWFLVVIARTVRPLLCKRRVPRAYEPCVLTRPQSFDRHVFKCNLCLSFSVQGLWNEKDSTSAEFPRYSIFRGGKKNLLPILITVRLIKLLISNRDLEAKPPSSRASRVQPQL